MSQPSDGMATSMSMSMSGVSDGPSASVMRRRWGDRGRLNVELRFLGMIGMVWVSSLAQAVCWLWVAVEPTSDWRAVPWLTLAAPQVIALTVVMVTLAMHLPRARWSRRGSLRRLPPVWPLLIVGFPALVVAPFLAWRDRRARLKRQPPTPAAIEAAFHQLVHLPRIAGLQFLFWFGLAYVGNALILGVHFDWPRHVALGLTLLWAALLGPMAAIVVSRGRAILRPEYLTAPRIEQSDVPSTGHMGVKLAVNASIASVGAIAAPLAAGYLWMWSHAARTGHAEAEQLGAQVLTLAAEGQEQHLGRLLGRNPRVTVERGSRRYGNRLQEIPERAGLQDLDGDGIEDVLVRRSGSVTAIVPLGVPAPIPVNLLIFAGFFCLAGSAGAVVLLARNVQRDVVRATAQVDSVAKGAAPPPLTEASFSTRELRQLVQSVDRLVTRITEANVAKYIAIEKAKEADRLKNQFLANMSHDLRSPLNSVLGFSELLLTGIDGPLHPEHRDMVATIQASGRDLLQEIDDILDMARIEAGRLEVHPEPSPPANLISRAIQSARRRGNERVEYIAETAPGLPPAFVDPLRTVQALENLLLFAAERLESGTVEVHLRGVRTEDGRAISLRIKTPEPPATAHQLALAHQGFHRIPGHRGLGLGLPIANAIITLQGGHLGIEDHGHIMIFSVVLPAPETRRAIRHAES